ncbi:MAG: thiamine pyrophosphate-requiring protein [Chloroflexi bacterium]|nr:thiamine pyrophosphate-requiring protein [Chloroflexota bacterium]OJV92877.1 MAG: thiamine pyrophosphate-requiring protein [Chloroflexi bacterium 54-19]
MAATASDYLLERLSEWNVETIFGYPGDGINGILVALGRAGKKFNFIQAAHEEIAAFMACGYAKYTGKVGVCMATSGPGAIHLLNGLYDAKLDHQPVVAIVGQSARTALGGSYQQEVDLQNLFKDVASDFVQTAMVPGQLRHLVDRAFRIALSQRTVTCIIIPKDVQEEEAVEEEAFKHNTIHSGPGYLPPLVFPPDEQLQKAADILNAGKKVAILAGAGARGATDELIEVADLLGAGIAKALLGKDVVPDDLPFVTGSIGLLGTKPSWDMMTGCDTLLMVGSSFPYSEFLPKPGQARGIQIDIDAKMLSIRFPMELPLVGDSKETLKRLAKLLKRKEDRGWRQEIEKNIGDWWKVVEARSRQDGSDNLLNPERVFWELSPKLPDNCILAADSGSSANWYARDLKFKRGMLGSLSGNLATMCPGVPYALGAKFAYPDRPVVAVIGDGAMEMLGNNGLITIAKYWKEWSNHQLIILVLKNNDLNQVSWEMRIETGDPRYEASQDVFPFPFARYAEIIGLKGIKMEKVEDIERGWAEAFAADRPVVVEARTDPNTFVLPPHITLEQAKNFTSSLLKGDADRVEMVKQETKSILQGILPH